MVELLTEDWGEWTLGDLPSILAQAAELLDPSSQVLYVEAGLPTPADPLPEVHVLVSSRGTAARMRREIEEGEFLSDFDADPGDGSWSCRVAGLALDVRVKEVAR